MTIEGVKSNLKLKNGEERAFINDGDTVIFSGYCESKDGYRVGFGESPCKVKPALPLENYYWVSYKYWVHVIIECDRKI